MPTVLLLLLPLRLLLLLMFLLPAGHRAPVLSLTFVQFLEALRLLAEEAVGHPATNNKVSVRQCRSRHSGMLPGQGLNLDRTTLRCGGVRQVVEGHPAANVGYLCCVCVGVHPES